MIILLLFPEKDLNDLHSRLISMDTTMNEMLRMVDMELKPAFLKTVDVLSVFEGISSQP